MAAVISEEQLLCSICLKVFVEPVSTPCGHNFCKSCISTHWQQGEPCLCPLCKQEFSHCPPLQVNSLVSELVGQFRKRPEEGTVSSAGELLCDMCTESKHKALKSCLVCQMSYCQHHLLAHQSLPLLKSHTLTEPLQPLEEQLCSSHHRALELYCRSEQTCLCTLCTVHEHKEHPVVSLREEYEQQQEALESEQAQTKCLMKERMKKIREVQHWLQLSDSQAVTETERGLRLHKALMYTLQSGESNLTQEIEEQQRNAHRQAEQWTSQLQQEIEELQLKSTALEQLQHSDNHLTFLQNLPRLKTITAPKYYTQINLQEPDYDVSVDRIMDQLNSDLIQKMKKQEIERKMKWAVDLTLDPDTADPELILSDDLKEVSYGGVESNLPNDPKRFPGAHVLGKQSFSSGRFYFEVKVEGGDWDVGVVSESVEGERIFDHTPTNGVWCIALSIDGNYLACDETEVNVYVNPFTDVIGVFVDYEQGLVSFYESYSGALIYSFTDCKFTEKIYPFLRPSVFDEFAPLTLLPCGQNLSKAKSYC